MQEQLPPTIKLGKNDMTPEDLENRVQGALGEKRVGGLVILVPFLFSHRHPRLLMFSTSSSVRYFKILTHDTNSEKLL